jgi:integral membrane sensor domain MASE1
MPRAETGEANLLNHSGLITASYVGELAVIAVGYFVLVAAGRLLPALNAVAMPLWPPTGIAFGLFLLRGNHVWPAVLIGSFCANAISPALTTPSDSPASAVATTVAALAGAWLLDHWVHGHNKLDSPANIIKFIVIAFAPTAMISSTLTAAGAGVASALGLADSAAVSTVAWAEWWLLDASGIAITAPVILLWATKPFSKSNAAETIAIIVATVAIGMISYSPAIGNELSETLPNRDLLGFLILLPLIWAGLRGNQRDLATAVLVFCALAAWGLSVGADTLPPGELNRPFLSLLALSTSTSFGSLILGAAVASRDDATAHLASSQSLLKFQLDQTKLALQTATRNFQIFIDGVADYAIFLLDTSGRVTSWSSTAQKVVGYNRRQALRSFVPAGRAPRRRTESRNRNCDSEG